MSQPAIFIPLIESAWVRADLIYFVSNAPADAPRAARSRMLLEGTGEIVDSHLSPHDIVALITGGEDQ